MVLDHFHFNYDPGRLTWRQRFWNIWFMLTGRCWYPTGELILAFAGNTCEDCGLACAGLPQ